MTPRRNGNPLPILKGLHVFWRILGLCPFVLVEGDEILRSSYIGIFYSTIITLAYVVVYFRAIVNRTNFVLSNETAMIIIADFSGLSVEFLVVVSTWLYFAFRQNKLKGILKSLKKIHETSKDIGIDHDVKKIVKTVKIHTVIVNLIWFVLYCSNHILLSDCKAFNLAIWMPFNFPRIVTHNVVIMFVDAMLVVKKLFYLLNEKIYNLSREVASRPNAIVNRNRRDSKNDGLESFVTTGPLEAYGRIHSDLVTLTKMIVKFFSLSIILTVLVQFIQMALNLYILCLMARDSRFSTWKEKVTFVVVCCFICFHFGQTVVLMAISDSTANEANRAGSVLHKMLTSGHPEKYLDSAQILSVRLLQRRLNIDLYGLFEMRLSVVHTIIGMTGTYITIMMQLDTQNIRQENINRSLEEPFRSEVELLNDTSTTDSN